MRPLIVPAALMAAVLFGVGAASSVSSSAGTYSTAGWKTKELGYGFAYDLNERGEIVGESSLPGDAVLWQNGKERALEIPVGLALEDDSYPVANAINDGTEIVGGTWYDEYAFRWRNRKVETLLPLDKRDRLSASDVNNRGQVVGWSGYSAVAWEEGQPRALPGRACDEAYAINDDGNIVGVVSTRCDKYEAPLYPRAALWEAETLRILLPMRSGAADINNRGQVVGWRKPAWARLRRGFLWENGTIRDLGSGFLPRAINDRGQIVGSCGKRACVWQSGKLTKLDELYYHDAVATAINERQQIVGYAIEGGGDSELMPLGVVLLWTFKP